MACALLALLGVCAGAVRAEETGEEDHGLVLEVGAAGEKPVTGGASRFGGTIGAEVTPIENWLELEFGLTALAGAGHTELSGDLIFKKPYRLSEQVEFMIGAGPSFAKTLNGPDRGTAIGAEVAADFMIWPSRRLGWYVEPTWGIVPHTHEQSVGLAIGLLIGVP